MLFRSPYYHPETEERLPDENKECILIIDDNADVRGYVKSLLKEEYTVIEAADGHAGLKKAMKYVPDAIICDVMMPVMDGLECCRKLKMELQTSHIPVMLLTACSLDEQRIQGFECGAAHGSEVRKKCLIHRDRFYSQVPFLLCARPQESDGKPPVLRKP